MAYECSEILSRSLNNRATRDAAIAAFVSSKHAVTGTRSKGRGFTTG